MKRLGILLAALLLAGCTSSLEAPAPMPTSSQFNPGDVMFLQMLIAHHGPAERMLDVAKTRAQREDLRNLAVAILKTQADETRTMTDWLTLWNQPVRVDSNPDAHAHHGGLPPSYDAQINALREATDAEFDRTFINLFAAYQQRAVELARFEIQAGSNPQALDLAGRVEKSREGQVQLLGGWS